MSQNYSWQIIYRTAVLETDAEKLRILVAQTEDAIYMRLENEVPLASGESVALSLAVSRLAILKTERLLLLKRENN